MTAPSDLLARRGGAGAWTAPPLPVFISKDLRAWPKHEQGGRAVYQLAPAALRAWHATDAHTAAYSAPAILRRLDKGAPGQGVNGAPLVVPVAFLFVDVDGADHEASPDWRQSEAVKIARALAELPGGFCYQTRGGYRLVWRLAQPFPITGLDDAARWRRHYWRALLSLSRRFAIEGDPACSDWTRLYRLPHATRDEGGQPEDLPTEGNPELLPAQTFEPDPADLALDLAEARRLDALHPASKDDAGKTRIAGLWGVVVKALAREAGEPEGETAPSPLALVPAPARPRGHRPTREDRQRLWAEKALDNMANDLGRAGKGNRNNAARNAGLVLGHYAPHLLNPSDIERRLLAATRAARWDNENKTLDTIRRAIHDGMGETKWPEIPDDEPSNDRGATMPGQTADDHDHEEQGPASGPQPANNNDDDNDERPAVLVDFETGQRIRETEAALAARDDLNLYVRDGRLVSVQTSTSKRKRAIRDDAGSPLARDLELPALRAMLTDTIRFEQLVTAKDEKGKIIRGDDGKAQTKRVRCRPHDDIVKGLHKAPEWPELRDLVGIVRAPFLASLDGTVVTSAGYHEGSGYLLVTPPGYGAVDVPDRPTREQALAAVATLKDLLCDFPFAGDRDRSAALAALLSLAARPALGGENVPGFVFEANTSSAGKTKLADTLAIIATGAQSPKQGFTRDEAEMEKLLGGLAGEARALLTFDNITDTIGGSKLDLVLTCNGSFSYRLLGHNRTVQSAWRTVVFFTANNPTIGGDIGRRLLVCRLDCAESQPSKREGFKYQLPRYALEHRASLAGCALTILRAFCQVPERKRPKVRAMGSFEAWSQLVAGALLWLGEVDPLEAVADERNEGMDPNRMAHVAIVEHWNELRLNTRSALRWTDDGISVRAAIDALYPSGGAAQGDGLDDLREALEVLAPPAGGKPPTVAKVGYALRHLRGKLTAAGEIQGNGKPTTGGKLVGKPDRNGVMVWRVESKPESKVRGMRGIAGDVSNQSYPAGSKGEGEVGSSIQDGGHGGGLPRSGGNDPPQSPASPAADPLPWDESDTSPDDSNPVTDDALAGVLRTASPYSAAFQSAEAEAERRPPTPTLAAALAAARARSEGRPVESTPTPAPASGVAVAANDLPAVESDDDATGTDVLL